MDAFVSLKKAYIEGIAQRRIRYTFVYSDSATLKELIARATRAVDLIAGEWNASICKAALPSLGVLAISWFGGTLLADLSICFPISRPLPKLDAFLEAPFNKVSICLEPIAPIGHVESYSTVRISTVRGSGRISLRGDVAIVKMKGLYFFARAYAEPDPAGGVTFRVAVQSCAGVDPLEGLLEARRILKRRGGSASAHRRG